MTEISTVQVPPLTTWPNIELAQTGQWDISTGRVTLTLNDFSNAIAALECPAVRNPVIKLGHSEPMPDAQKQRWDGEPAIGWVDNMATADSGGTIVGDFTGMPGWLGSILPSAYPDRSMEATWDFQCQLGHIHPFVITAVALLGVTPPGIGTLGSLQDVANLYGIQASIPETESGYSVTIQAKGASQMPNPRPKEIAAGVTTEDVRRQYYDSGVAYTTWIKELQLDPPQLITVDEATGEYARVPVTIDGDNVTFGDPVPVAIEYIDKPEPAQTAASRLVYASKDESRQVAPERQVEPTLPPAQAIHRVHKAATQTSTEQGKGAGDMDPAKIREALGLSHDASDDDVFAAISASRQTSTPTTDPAPAAPTAPAVAAGSGVRIVDQSVLDMLTAQAKRGDEAYRLMQEQSRDRVIEAAVNSGKFAPNRADHFRALWDADPDGTEKMIRDMAPNLVPLQAAGYASAAETAEADSAYYALYPEEKGA